jgi:hypothetical protein
MDDRHGRSEPPRDPRVAAELGAITAEHYLVCTCWPRHCHGEVVLEAWRWLNRKAA